MTLGTSWPPYIFFLKDDVVLECLTRSYMPAGKGEITFTPSIKSFLEDINPMIGRLERLSQSISKHIYISYWILRQAALKKNSLKRNEEYHVNVTSVLSEDPEHHVNVQQHGFNQVLSSQVPIDSHILSRFLDAKPDKGTARRGKRRCGSMCQPFNRRCSTSCLCSTTWIQSSSYISLLKIKVYCMEQVWISHKAIARSKN